jgi:hypothetical protein
MNEDEAAPVPPLETMKRLLDAQRLRLGVHIRKMNSPGSPVYRAGENIWPAAVILVSSFAATVAVHFYLGAAILAAGCWWWLAKVQPKVRDGVFDRSSGWALQSENHFDAMWAKGVLSLYAEMPDGRKLAATRRDDWRSFVRMVARESSDAPSEEAA